MEQNTLIDEQATQSIEKAIADDKTVVPYSPMSKMPIIAGGTSVPLSLAGETLQAQFKVQEDILDIDEYAVTKLGYTSKIMLSDKLSAEQVDASVLAIRQIERGKGFILADMAGIGKGRICASVLRYAYIKGYLPIFITEADNLFTAIYRDLRDVGGIGFKKMGKPFILNGYQNGGTELAYNEKGIIVKKAKAPSTSILDEDGSVLIDAPPISTIRHIIKGDSIPNEFDFMMLTYSQLSGENGRIKVDFILRLIEKLQGKVVLVMDECHNATGTTSSTGKAVVDILGKVQGALYSSATFSKRPENMFLYSFKTDIIDSPLDTKRLLELIKKGGERLIENLASSLVLAQQMIRRERSYDNCDVSYEYMSLTEKDDTFSRYDKTITTYKRLVTFFNSQLFKDAKQKAIDRFALSKKVEINKTPRPKRDKNVSLLEYQEDIKNWEVASIGKYELKSFTAGEISRSTFNFVESLLFALKADFVANRALGQLQNNDLVNTNIDKTTFKSNRKPVIAVRNTLEGIFLNLGLQVGDIINKPDFSMYLKSMATSGINGFIKIQQITSKDIVGKILKGDANIEYTDFEDKGVMYKDEISKIDDLHLDIPLSPIDYVIDKIKYTKRPIWDAERYEMVTGKSQPNFKVGEVTGRNLTLVPIEFNADGMPKLDGDYQLQLNQKDKNKSKTFKQFNNGTFDVLIINESGSTGEDAHSKNTFADQRPRVMIIHQVELDVATEVQKRGRINRTGMVNYPSYIYAVSRIPSEIRRLLMLAKKLRSLDANTTANQKQSAKLFTIRDSNDNPIEDISNKIGDECLTEFINVAENADIYKQYMPTTNQEGLGKLSNNYIIEQFARNLELSICKDQETFYNTINTLYISKVEELKGKHVYDLETNLIDLKAVIHTRVKVQVGLDTNPFNSNVYEEENYILAEDIPYDNEKVQNLVLELSKGEDDSEFYNKFVEDYKNYFKTITLVEIKENVKIPEYDLAKDKKEIQELIKDYDERVKQTIERATKEYEEVLFILDHRQSDGTRTLKPNSKKVIPVNTEECFEVDDDGNPVKILDINSAKFVGVRITNAAKAKYSPMNIELIFCQLSGIPKLTIKPTLRGRVILDWIIKRTVSIFRIQEIDRWIVDPNRRTKMRIFTGNILGAYGIAKDRVSNNKVDYSPVVDFLKFTTADSLIRIGIKLNMRHYSKLIPSNTPITYALNSKELLDVLSNSKGVKVINTNEDFYLVYDIASRFVTINILGGNIVPRKVKNYYSKLYDDGILFDDNTGLLSKKCPPLIKKMGTIDYKPIGRENFQRINTKQISGKLPESQTELQEIIDYIYSVDPFNISLRNIEDSENFENRLDIPMDKLGIQELEREGEFIYETSIPIDNLTEQLQSLTKFNKIVKVSSFGDVYFNRRPNIREAISYGLIPTNNTLIDMVSDTFSSLPTDTERIKFKELISKSIKNGDSDFDIGLAVDDILSSKNIPLISIFGNSSNNIEYVGSVFSAYSRGEIDLPLPPEKLVPKQYEMPLRPLTLDTAQEYIILLAYKIKN